MVRIHPDPPSKTAREPIAAREPKMHQGKQQECRSERGCSSVGRAPALQAGGRRFDPVQLHHLGRRRPESANPAQSAEVNVKVYF
jgi:hypothetical protein